ALGIGGGGGFLTGRGQANALTRATAILAALFFLTSLTLTIMANVNHSPKSILNGVVPASTAPAGAPPALPKGGNLLNQLENSEKQKSQPAAPLSGGQSAPTPSAPSAPAPPRSP
ncbi:MAG TPA: preprotein translocase subunit SecG, partial [Beijerinckiaceae bacterium]|nr:preprotein translocase subunit SecG [Beijerinckiaceae bacterium]